MNDSGRSVAAMANYYRIEPDEILIAHDELDVPPGESRFKHDGGHGGHNGLRDVIPALGGRKDFWRLRIGIGHPGSARQVSSWVLSKASVDDQTSIEASIESAIAALPLLLAGDAVKAMTALHSEHHQLPPNNEG
jgi:PTH1 family peptidyl-tRNA hydrolase